MRVWIDTDVGTDPDDAVALLLAAAHPGLELVGVSTVSGDVEARAGVARRLLGEGVPIAAGCPPVAAFEGVRPDALLAIGPLTNVARLVERGARVPERFVWMGGALAPVYHRGAWHEVEHNAAADPAAARLVVERCASLVVVPLDVTAAMVLSEAHRETLLRARPELVPDVVAWDAPLCLHDPLALLVLAGEVDVTTQRYPVGVEPDGRVSRNGPERTVVTQVATDAARHRILELLAT